jgi:hypothetical protein
MRHRATKSSSGRRRGSDDIGKRNFPARYAQHKVRATRLAATDFYIFTEITMTTPPLTRVLDRLIGGGIILCDDVV